MFDQPEAYESDLEWMLRSSQATPELIVEYIIKEQYSSIYRRCLALVGDPAQAEQAALETVVMAVEKRHEYRERASAQAWLAALTIQSCRLLLRRPVVMSSGRHTVDQVAAQSKPAPRSLSPEQLRLQRVLNGLRVSDLELLLLSSLFALPDEDLADLIHSGLDETRQRLEGIHRRMHAALLAEVSASDEIGAALSYLWPEVALEPGASERLVDRVLHRLEQRQSKRITVRFLQQTASVLGIFVLALGIIWLSNRLSERRTPTPLVARTVIVTQLVYITPTPTSVATPPALSPDLPVDEVRSRLMNSRSYWSQLWAEALIYVYGAPGYVGPPSVMREQIWAIKPDYYFVLRGTAGLNADAAYLQEGKVRYARQLPDGSLRRLRSHMPQDEVSSLARLIHPDMWFDESFEISVHDSARIAGLPALWISYVDVDGLTYRAALDVVTGVVLAMQVYDPRTQMILMEVILSKIVYEPKPSLPVFDSGMAPENFVRDYSGLPLFPDEVELLPAVELAPPRQARDRISTQEDIDFSKSEINFQWRSSGEMISEGLRFNEVKFVPVEIFAGENFLGEALVANPWGLVCRRSPDGSKLALLEQPEAAPFPSGRLRWLDLTQPVNQVFQPYNLLPEHREVSGDFAFSPDGNSLAFWGCWAEREQCGIYIADLVTRAAPVLWSTDYATSFHWSPDGKALAFVRWFYNELVVLDIDNYQIRYTENLQQEDREALRPEEFAWLSDPVTEAGGLESCRLPPNQP